MLGSRFVALKSDVQDAIKVKKLEIIHGTPIIDLWGVE